MQHHANISAWWGKLFAAHAFFKESQKAVFIPRSRFYWVKLLFRKNSYDYLQPVVKFLHAAKNCPPNSAAQKKRTMEFEKYFR